MSEIPFLSDKCLKTEARFFQGEPIWSGPRCGLPAGHDGECQFTEAPYRENPPTFFERHNYAAAFVIASLAFGFSAVVSIHDALQRNGVLLDTTAGIGCALFLARMLGRR